MPSDFSALRRNMVDCQIRTSDVTNPGLIAAFLDVPREEFVPDAVKSFAYVDEDAPVGGGRFLLAPASLARLLQAASVGPRDTVLDVGCGCGYASALLSRMAAKVVALESTAEMAQATRARLARLGFGNVTVVEGPLPAGHAAGAPYDVIFVGGSLGQAPQTLAGQLKPGGRMVAVEGQGNAAMARLWVNDDGDVSARRLFNCAVPPLAGFERAPEFVF